MVGSDDSRVCEMDLSLFLIVCVSITTQAETSGAGARREYSGVLSGVVPPLFLERWAGFHTWNRVGAIGIWGQ